MEKKLSNAFRLIEFGEFLFEGKYSAFEFAEGISQLKEMIEFLCDHKVSLAISFALK